MKRIRVSGAAERDLDEIWKYIAERAASIDVADRVVDSIVDTFPVLARAPAAGRKRDDIESGVRCFPVANYIVYYRATGRYVVIARVIHGMRDQRSAFTAE